MKLIILGAKNPETGFMIDAITQHQKTKGSRIEFRGFIDNDPALRGTEFLGLPVFGGFDAVDDLIAEGCHFVSTITRSTAIRYETAKAIRDKGGTFANFIHPSVRAVEKIGVGNYIQDKVVLQAGVTIGGNCSIHAGAIIAHETTIGHSVFIAPAASVSGVVTIGDGVYIGGNATILPRLTIGAWATVGAGAVVLRDVPPGAVVSGNPARIIRHDTVDHADGAI